jgi:hypothetical protein
MSKIPAHIECDICRQKCGEVVGWWPFQRVITKDGFITLDRSYVRIKYDEFGPEPVTRSGKFHICNTCMEKFTAKIVKELIREKE